MQKKVVYLLRHGDTGMTGRYIGSTDISLSKRGVRQVVKSGVLLHEAAIERAFCSPLLRCRQSFDLLDLGCDYSVEGSLSEVNFGLWEKKSFAEIVEKDKSLVDAWVAAPENFSFPGGESLVHFRQRLLQFTAMLDEISQRRLLIVTHGGVIRHLLCLFLKLGFDKYLVFDVQPGRFSTVDVHPEGGVLTGFNIGG